MIAAGTMPPLDTVLKASQPLMIPVGRDDNCHVVEVNCDVQPVCEEHYLHRRRKAAPRNGLRSGCRYYDEITAGILAGNRRRGSLQYNSRAGFWSGGRQLRNNSASVRSVGDGFDSHRPLQKQRK